MTKPIPHSLVPVAETTASSESGDQLAHPTPPANAVDKSLQVSGKKKNSDLPDGSDDDSTLDDTTFDKKEWYALTSRIAQQNVMIKAMIRIFGWLNGSVIAFILLAWGLGFTGKQQIITEHVIMSLIGATIIQAGLAFITITKFLFPSAIANNSGETPRSLNGGNPKSGLDGH